jgi:DNA repair exonuclease SbcCD nuclease subunit
MKLAITADLHLTARDRNPERFQTLETMLYTLRDEGIETLIVAGDLFDATRRDYADFERLCAQETFADLQILVIPGNHDPALDNSKFALDNVDIISEPALRELDGRPFLFLPYRQSETMGDAIAPLASDLQADRWVLIAHGDWAQGLRQPNPAEPGVYMPLTRRDVERYRPARVFLGHIHRPLDAPPVHYVGSPCGLDITETGRRRCLCYETGDNSVQPLILDTPVLYFDETFVVVPLAGEATHLRQQIAARIEAWDLAPAEKARTQLRVKVAGYASDRAALGDVLQEAFQDFAFYKGQAPDIGGVLLSDDLDRQAIAQEVRRRLHSLRLPNAPDDPGPDDVLLQALHIIYGS